MPAERESPYDRGSLRPGSAAAPAPKQHRDAACRHRNVQDAASVASGVPSGGDHMGSEQNGEQAAKEDMGCLEVAVASPEPPART